MKPADLKEGSLVLDADGNLLGRIVKFDEDCFTVKHGRVLPRLVDVHYDEIAAISGDEVRLRDDPENYSEGDARREPAPPERVTGPEAGYDFGGADEEPVSSLDSDRRVTGIEAGMDFGADRKVIS